MTELDSREDSENLDFPPLEGFKEAFTGPHYSDAETERIRNEYDQGKFQFEVFWRPRFEIPQDINIY